MIATINEGDFHIHQGVASKDTILGGFAHTFFNG